MAEQKGIFGDLFGKKDDDKPKEAAKPTAADLAKEKQAKEAEAAANKAKHALDDKKASEAAKIKANLAVDGNWGASTTAAVQKALGQPLTGEAWINNSDATVLQQKLGITADGLFGKGSNTAIYAKPGPEGDQLYYAFDDWGATFGKWGGFFSRDKWNADGFRQQSRNFVRCHDGKTIVTSGLQAGERAQDFRIARLDDMMRAERLRFGLLGRARRERGDFAAPRARERGRPRRRRWRRARHAARRACP